MNRLVVVVVVVVSIKASLLSAVLLPIQYLSF